MMIFKLSRFTVSSLVLAVGCGTLAHAQTISGTLTQPALDRWNYPFSSQPGAEPSVPIFAALNQAGFDDRDGQFLFTFDTSGTIPAGYGNDRYLVGSVRVTAWISVDNRFAYDPTFDSVRTSYDPADPQYLPDGDTGKPMELFAVGFRNGWTGVTFQENSPFSPYPPFPPREGVRSAFPALYDAAGVATDVSRQVRQKFEAHPLAVGQTDAVQPGELVPAGAMFTFDIDASDPIAQAYFSRAFNSGRVPLIITSLNPASGGPGGGTGDPNYPAFFTKENATAQLLGYAVHMDLSVAAYPGADFNLDGGIDGADIEAFFVAWEAGDGIADFNMDGGVDGNDVQAFFIAWEHG
ncbi:MAG: hypothetical protein JSR77_00085 [Planctomycetes bacterium]|nr:hypothetical protein [Planctomycetota bacterium]